MTSTERKQHQARCGELRKASAHKIRAGILSSSGHTIASLAYANNLTPQALFNVIYGSSHTPRLLEILRSAGAQPEHLYYPDSAIKEGENHHA